MSRFDPSPDEDYGYCMICNVRFKAESEARAHMSETLEQAETKGHRSGHAIRVSNPPRSRKIADAIQRELDEALDDFFNAIDDWVYKGDLTQEEANEFMNKAHVDIEEEWESFNE